jgi:hypothetical protein
VERGYIPAAFVAIGLVIGGYFVGNGFARGRASDRYVEVKGLAEREVTANLALWPLRVSASANELASAQAQITRAAAEQFASDSGSALGGIRQANQGVFVILPRDQAPGANESSQLRKIVRVISTVQ